MNIVLCDFTTSYLFLLVLLITISLPSYTVSLFSLKIKLSLTTTVSQIDITYPNGTQTFQDISYLNSLNNEIGDIDYGTSIAIQTTGLPVSFCGYIEINQYLFYSNNKDIWIDNIELTSISLTDCGVCGEASVNSNIIRIKIPEDEINLQLKADEIVETYTCDSMEYKLLLGNEFSFDIASLISPSGFIGHISIMLTSSPLGIFKIGNNILQDVNPLITEDTSFIYTTPISLNGNAIQTYTEVITYYVYTNKVYTQLCNEGIITLIICGTGCQDCEWDAINNNYYCISCITDYYFMEYNTQYCVPLSSKPSNYYIQDNKYFLPCYYKCATCETASIDDNKQKCLTCSDTYKYALYQDYYSTYNCYSNCTEGISYQVEDTNTCISTCIGTSTPYDYNGIQCFSECPNYLISASNKCVDSCLDELTYEYISGNGKECVENCRSDTDYPFISKDGTRCVQSCPKYTLNNSQCADECDSIYSYKDEVNKNCMTSCENLYEIQDTKKCVSACPKDENLYKITLSLENIKCVSQCSGSSPYLNLELKECVPSCPTNKPFHINTSLQCVTSCPDSSKYYHDKTCYIACPNSFPYIKGYTNECMLDCEDNEYKYISIDDKRCVRTCEANQVILENNRCASSCTSTYSFYYSQNNTCYSKCPSTLYELIITNNNKECVDKCVNPLYPYAYETQDIKKCTNRCDQNLPYLDIENKECVDICPNSKSKVLPPYDICVSQCSGDYPYNYNTLCVNTCPTGAKFISEDLLTCVNDCPHKISSNGINCIEECDINDLVTLGNKTCALSCTDDFRYYYAKNATCLNKCEDNGLKYYKNEYKCVDSCDSKYPYLVDTSSKCTDNCKEDNKFLHNNKCLDSCSGLKILPPDNKCVSSCQGDYEYLHYETSTCVTKCENSYPYYISNSKTCYTTCQDPYKYIKEGEYECLLTCPNSHKYIKDGTVCVKECNETTSMFYYGNTCVSSCEDVQAYQLGNTYICEDACNSEYGLYVEGESKCVSVCEGSTILRYGNTCVSSCPTEAPYIVPITNECVDKCNEGSYKYIDTNNNKCIEKCGGDVEYLVNNNTQLKCYHECPGDFPYKISNTNECSATCTDEYKYLYNDVCLLSCPDGYKISQLDMRCVTSCESIGQFDYGDTIYCVEECSNQFPYLIPNINKCTNICPTSAKYLNGTTCVDTCPPGYQSILPINETCVSSCPNELPYKNINSNYCRESCDDINAQYLDFELNLCINQCEDDQFEITEMKQCYNTYCPSQYPFKINYPPYKRCVQQCNISPYVYTDYINKECLISCMETSLYQYGDQCLQTCPLFTISLNGICELDMHVINENEEYIITEMNKSDLLERMNFNIIDLINLNKTIKGNDYLLQIYSSSFPIKSNNETSSMIFDTCEYILKQKYNITNDIIIAKFDYINITAITNQIQYKAFNMNGDELDLSLCMNETINIMYPINTPMQIKLNEAYTLYQQGIDIYNINDPFFSDICYPYTINGYDLSLNERIVNYYSNISLCENNCIYMYLNYSNNKAICSCKVKNVFEMEFSNEINTNNKEYVFNNNTFKDKIKLIKCYKLLTEWKYIKNNLSFWLFGVMNVVNVVYLFVNITFEMKQLYTSLNKICKGNPPKRVQTHNNINNKDNNSIHFRNIESSFQQYNNHNIITQAQDNNIHEIERAFMNNDNFDLSNERMVNKVNHSCDDITLNDTWMSHTDAKPEHPIHLSIIKYDNNNNASKDKQLPTKEIEIDLTTFIPIITTYQFNNLPYFIANQLDNRSFCSIYFSLFKQRHFLIRACFRLSPLDVPSLNIMLFLLYIILLFMFNALFYKKNIFALSSYGDDTYLNQFKYKYACLYGFISVLLSSIVTGCIRRMVDFEKKYNVINIEMRNDDYAHAKILKKVLMKFQIMFGICLGIDMCVYSMLWYYLSVFNVVYNGNQYKWFIWGCISIAYTFIISVVFCFIITVIRCIGIKCHSQTFYNIALFLQGVYLL